MKRSIMLLASCVALGAALTACKGKTAAPAESEAETSAAAAEGESPGVASPGHPVQIVREVGTRVEVDTSAPANVGTVPEDAQRSDSGLAWIVLTKGTGEAHPTEKDIAVMNFIGWTADGKLVNESLTSGRSAGIPVGALFPGWSEGVQLMVAGEKRRFWIPGKLAFGEATADATADKKRPRGMLVYDVELAGFGPAPERLPPPKHLGQ